MLNKHKQKIKKKDEWHAQMEREEMKNNQL
jgi:hypothetical protein